MTKDEAARRVFDGFDTNKDGQISHQEWAFVESRAAAREPEADRQQYVGLLEIEFKRLDLDGDGSINFAEWKANNRPPQGAG